MLINKIYNFKSIIIIILVLSTTFARAEWIKFSESNKSSYYFDNIEFPSNIIKGSRDSCDSPGCKRVYFERRSDIQRIFILINNSYIDSNNVHSFRILFEFNCKKLEYKIISKTNFTQPMGNGKILSIDDSNSILRLDDEHDYEVFKHLKITCTT